MSSTAAPTRRTIYNPLQKDWATFLETAEESGGTRTRLELVVAPGGGNMPHIHLTYAESFEVVEGRLQVRRGNEWHDLGPGESAHVPAGVVHCFRNATDAPVTCIVLLDPGHRGMEKALQAGYGLAADGLVDGRSLPRNPFHMAVLMEWSEMRVTGALRLAVPLFHLLGVIARRRGVDRELEARYVKY